MEMQKRKADTPADTDHHDRARLIRSIVADAVLDLGVDRAWVRTGVVRIAPAAERGRQPGRSGCDPSEQFRGWLIPCVHQAALTKASAVTFPPDAAMIATMVSRVMFCCPLRMREIEASVSPTFAPNSEAVGAPLERRY